MTIDIRDKPLRVHLSVGLHGIEALDLRTGDVKQDAVTAGILGQLGDMALRHDRRFISYSRRKQWWIGAMSCALNLTLWSWISAVLSSM